MSWLTSGNLPTLWTYARLLFALGMLSIVGSFVNGVLMIWTVFGQKQGGIDMPRSYSVSAVFSALTFTTSAALFLTGSAVIAYLAGKQDREQASAIAAAAPRA